MNNEDSNLIKIRQIGNLFEEIIEDKDQKGYEGIKLLRSILIDTAKSLRKKIYEKLEGLKTINTDHIEEVLNEINLDFKKEYGETERRFSKKSFHSFLKKGKKYRCSNENAQLFKKAIENYGRKIIEKGKEIKSKDNNIRLMERHIEGAYKNLLNEGIPNEKLINKEEIEEEGFPSKLYEITEEKAKEVKVENEKILFCRTGWMKYYKGITENDNIIGGGSHIDEKGWGAEIFNFKDFRGTYYGYVQGKNGSIDITRLGADDSDESVDNVIVIWVAKNPDGSGQFIYGIYKKSRVYRKPQSGAELKREYDNTPMGYNIVADAKNCKLIPVDERQLEVPSASMDAFGMGRSNVWYAEEEAEEYIDDVFEYINDIFGEEGQSSVEEINLNKTLKIDGLVFSDKQREKIERRTMNALRSGKSLILIGPPGSGKSKLASIICENYCEKNYSMSTATSDWSTFETIGGYQLSSDENETLEFTPGVFLKCFEEKDETKTNKWLIIDEINRADIDKAFGALFSTLAGDNIELPYQKGDLQYRIIGNEERAKSTDGDEYEDYTIPDDWRIIATMNTFDKASLYEMSYAFMRRFAFIPVGIPENIEVELIKEYINNWEKNEDYKFGIKNKDEILKKVKKLWKIVNKYREIGPALIEDICKYINEDYRENGEDLDWVSPIIMYILPQFEGLMDSELERFYNEITEEKFNFTIGENLRSELRKYMEGFFGIDLPKPKEKINN